MDKIIALIGQIFHSYPRALALLGVLTAVVGLAGGVRPWLVFPGPLQAWVVTALGAVLLVASTWVWFATRHARSQAAADELEALGIRSITDRSNEVDHTPVLNSSGPATIVLNDGHHFVQKYSAAIAERIRNNKPTKILLIHPDSPNLPLVAKKSDKSVEDQRRDIFESVEKLKALASLGKPANLVECRGHKYINTYMTTISDSTAVVSLYFNRMRVEGLTTMTLESAPNGLHKKYLDDVDRLWREAEKEADSDLFQGKSVSGGL